MQQISKLLLHRIGTPLEIVQFFDGGAGLVGAVCNVSYQYARTLGCFTMYMAYLPRRSASVD